MWTRILREQSTTARPNPQVLAQFFQLGCELMAGDVGAAQDAIKQLATDDGLKLIKDLTDKQIPQVIPLGAPAWSRILSVELIPLFRLLSHERVINSGVLEQQVVILYNFLAGVDASRLKTVYNFLTACLASWDQLNWPETAPSLMETMQLSLSVLATLIECNTTNMVNETYHPIVDSLTLVFDHRSGMGDDFFKLQSAKHLKYIHLQLGVGSAITAKTDTAQAPVEREQFLLRRDGPGALSAEGPRHDNDHADIAKISILPSFAEIDSPRAEYLPTNEPSQWHRAGIHGRLDREFRLLREDTVGQLRDTVGNMLHQIRGRDDQKASRYGNSARTYTYESPIPYRILFDRGNGLETVVRFRQPKKVATMDRSGRQDWWRHCKRLLEGALVSVIDTDGTVLFFVVSDFTLRTSQDRPRKKRSHANADGADHDEYLKLTLADDAQWAYVSLCLADQSDESVRQTLGWFRPSGPPSRRYLVEFPGVLLASFTHTLQALQQMSRQPNVPFTHLIAPTEKEPVQGRVDPPLYGRAAGFALDLGCIASDRAALEFAPQRDVGRDIISSRTALDPTQSMAFESALTRELCLIQGPPGTGKSFTGEKIIKGLVANKAGARLGPILCVCYTNHALDQLLEHLVHDGTKAVIRIGSRSKSAVLENLNLRVVATSAQRTKAEKRTLWEAEKGLDETVRTCGRLLGYLGASRSGKAVEIFLQRHQASRHEELFGSGHGQMEQDEADDSDEPWQTVDRNPGRVLQSWLAGGAERADVGRALDQLDEVPLAGMTRAERTRLHDEWVRMNREQIVDGLLAGQRTYRGLKKRRDVVRQDVDLRCLQEADVVGVTTTGLARNLELLRKLRCKVLVCEEAGEVLEAHILTALLPSVEHAILIGDHQQLRPQIQNYELQSTNPRGKPYSLDMSLFERLVQPPHPDDVRLPFSVIETQRRMHPDIAELVRSTLYPQLKDAEEVKGYPEVVGMRRRLFWMDHGHLEAGASEADPNDTSHRNEFEVDMTIGLVKHLVRQGAYDSEDIAVLTPYLGQLQKLRQRMSSLFEICLGDRDLDDLEVLEEGQQTAAPEAPSQQPKQGVNKAPLLKRLRIATVDNFQGEEAQVVVISLVRSNTRQKCGFLSTPNRINVLLSRARHGMYLIGNADTYSHVPMWAKVLTLLRDKGNVGSAFELQCPRHPDTRMTAAEPEDFVKFAPDGGCHVRCSKRLDCGHNCKGPCHADVLHKAFVCLEPCARFKAGCSHACPLACGKRCQERCETRLEGINLALPCGHTVAAAQCWEAQKPGLIQCVRDVSRVVPGCGHTITVPCHVDVAQDDFSCGAPCGHDRACGHRCKSPCHQCRERTQGKVTAEKHGVCKQVCGRALTTCRHACRQTCHGEANCPPCRAPCEVRCSHSRCGKTCHEPCAPCAEGTCASRCPHGACTMPYVFDFLPGHSVRANPPISQLCCSVRLDALFPTV